MRYLNKHFVYMMFAFMATLSGYSQEKVTFLDWDVIAMDTLCPVYSEAVPLESDYRSNTYSVCLEYPTWEKLSAREIELAVRYAHVIKDSIELSHYVSVNRGVGVLNYSFVPIVRRNGKFQKLTSAKIVINAIPVSAESRAKTAVVQRYAKSSVLSSGLWKKVHITKDGVYRLTPRLLAERGFRNPDNVHLYGYGGHQQSELLWRES